MAKMDKRFVSENMKPLIEKRKKLREEITTYTKEIQVLYKQNYNKWEKEQRREKRELNNLIKEK